MSFDPELAAQRRADMARIQALNPEWWAQARAEALAHPMSAETARIVRELLGPTAAEAAAYYREHPPETQQPPTSV